MAERRHTPVFYDRKGRRGYVVTFTALLAAVVTVAVLACLAVSLATPAVLPKLTMAIGRTLSHSLPSLSFTSLSPALDLEHLRSSDAEGRQVPRLAFYNSWDENGFFSLRTNSGLLDGLLPEWLHTSGADGAISRDDSRKESETRLWLQKNARHLRIMPVINNYDLVQGDWDGAAIDAMLASDSARQTLTENISAYLAEKRDHGVVVDFKKMSDGSIAAFIDFLAELKAALLPAGRKVLVVAPAYEKRWNLWKLSSAADQVILLAYDQHWEGGSAGPLGAQGWFEAQLDRAFATNSGNKFIVAIGSYAVDWNHDGSARRISVPEAWDILEESKSALHFEGQSLNPTFGYMSGSEGRQVWFLDGVTGYNQVAAALAMKPGGLALWRLGTEDPTMWSSFARGKIAEEGVLEDIKSLQPSGAILHKGEGEVLSVSDRHSAGRRTIEFQKEFNLIVSQKVIELPKSLSLHRWGHNSGKLLALTFDDGPSRPFTPRILDILKDKGVKATFFVVGANAALESRLLKRIYAEGHDIGNHTFTHPNLSSVGPTLLDLELNATQRILEAKIGVGTRLFRPPFNKDSEPEGRNEARTLINSAALGYITIGLKIDPLDWARPGVEEIIARTVSYADARRGSVILLHDGGGDRTQTVDALPEIIDRLHARGFRFVTVHELLGLKREEVMPPIHTSTTYTVSLNNAGFTILSTSTNLVGVLFFVSILLGMGRLLLVSAGAIVQQRRVRSRQALTWAPQSLAVIVPAYNEEKCIVDSVHALLAMDGFAPDILVVDDGSTDDTYNVAKAAFIDEPRVKVFTKENGGKASALNLGLQLTEAEIIVAIDADTRLDRDAITWMVRHFGDPKVGAVAGCVEVANQARLITRFQALEYVISQNLDRRAFEVVNGIIVVPGAIGAWRRQAVLDVGAYEEDTLAEDADLTLKLERAGWRILTEPKAFARTEAPQTTRLFLRQRFRWMFGMLQVAWKHREVIRQRGVGGVKYLTLPNIVFFQFFFALVAPVVDVLLVASLALDLMHYLQHDVTGLSPRTKSLAFYWAIWQVLEFGVAMLAFRLDGRRIPWSLLPLLILQRFCYRQLIYYVAIKSFAAAIRGSLIGWDKLPRQGFGVQQNKSGDP